MSSVIRNVAWGVAWGCAFAVGFSLFATLVAIRRGSTDFAGYGMSLGQIVQTYFAAGILAGSVAGVFRPLTRSREGATVTGAIVGPLVYGAVGFAMGDRGSDLIFFALVAGVPVGAICGFRFSKPDPSDVERPGLSSPNGD